MRSNRLAVIACAIALVYAAAYAAPTDRIPVSFPRAGFNASAGYSSITSAAGDSGFLVAWERKASWGEASYSYGEARLLDPDGRPLGDTVIYLPGVSNPKVLWLGGRYLVLGEKRAAWITGNGEITIFDSPIQGNSLHSAASDGTHAVAIYSGRTSPDPLMLTVIDPDANSVFGGALNRTDEVLVYAAATSAGFVVAAYSWRDGAASTMLVHPTGVEPWVTVGKVGGGPLATNGSELVWFWPYYQGIRAIRLSSRGVPLGEPVDFPNTAPPFYPQQLSAAWNGSEYVVAWQRTVIRVDAALVRSSAPVTLDGYGDVSSLVSNGRVTELAGYGNEELTGTSIDAAGTMISSTISTPTVAEQSALRAATADGVHLLAWVETLADNTTSVVMGRIDDDGLPLDGPGIILGKPGVIQSAPSVVASDQEFLVTWMERAKDESPYAGLSFAVRVMLNGVLSGDPVPLGHPYVAAAPGPFGSFLLAWVENQHVATARLHDDNTIEFLASTPDSSWTWGLLARTALIRGDAGYLLLAASNSDWAPPCYLECPTWKYAQATALSAEGYPVTELFPLTALSNRTLGSALAHSVWAFWDGTQYVAGWSDARGVMVAEISADGSRRGTPSVLYPVELSDARIIREGTHLTLAGIAKRRMPLLLTFNDRSLESVMTAPERLPNVRPDLELLGTRYGVRYFFRSNDDPAMVGSPRLYSSGMEAGGSDLHLEFVETPPFVIRFEGAIHLRLRNKTAPALVTVMGTASNECTIDEPCEIQTGEERVLKCRLTSYGSHSYRDGGPTYFVAASALATDGESQGQDNSLWAPVIVAPCGDANVDGRLGVADLFHMITIVFAGAPASHWGDMTGDGIVTVQDIVVLINALFAGQWNNITCS